MKRGVGRIFNFGALHNDPPYTSGLLFWNRQEIGVI